MPDDRLPARGSEIREMFARIAPRYDFLNRLLSLGIDRSWRRRLAGALRLDQALRVLDVACGTGDVAFELAGRLSQRALVVGVDFCGPMVEVARGRALSDRGVAGNRSPCDPGVATPVWVLGDALELPFGDRTFDRLTVAFGVRNWPLLERGLAELHRVAAPGALLGIVEFSRPPAGLFKTAYDLYSRFWLPAVGRLVSGHPFAYSYLPSSVDRFLSVPELAGRIESAGFERPSSESLTGGIATLYVARRPVL